MTKPATPWNESAVIADHNARRNEALKRIEFRYQLTNYALVIAGILFAIGIDSKESAVLLAYPLFALCFADLWVHNGKSTMNLGFSILNEIELRVFGGLGPRYETEIGININEKRTHIKAENQTVDRFAVIFLGTQAIAIVLAHYTYGFNQSGLTGPLFWSLLGIDLLILVRTWYLFDRYKRYLEAHRRRIAEEVKAKGLGPGSPRTRDAESPTTELMGSVVAMTLLAITVWLGKRMFRRQS